MSLEKSLLSNTIETGDGQGAGPPVRPDLRQRQAGGARTTPIPPRRQEMGSPAGRHPDAGPGAQGPAARGHRRRLTPSRTAASRIWPSSLSLISPSAAFGRLAADICGTGELSRTRYLEAVLAHQKALDNALFGKVKRTLMMHGDGRMTMAFQASPVDPKSLPKFTVSRLRWAKSSSPTRPACWPCCSGSSCLSSWPICGF